MLIFSKLQLLICLSAHSCARSSVSLSIEPMRITPVEGLVIFFSVNKQLTEHQHHGMVVGNQHSHNTKVCDKSWKENEENLKGGSKVVQDPLGYALVSTMITLYISCNPLEQSDEKLLQIATKPLPFAAFWAICWILSLRNFCSTFLSSQKSYKH